MNGHHPLDGYFRNGMLPHIWCSGCGNGIILNSFAKALQELDIDTDRVVAVSGIGCFGRISGYLNLDAFHTTHGCAIPFATGVSIVRPDLKIVVLSGDGDLFAIGGNHFIHAARKNLDMTVICANNFNYAMTGGQLGPTTPINSWTTTTPFGNIEHPFNLVYLAAASGAVYVARWTVGHFRNLTDSIKKALTMKGFTFIKVITPCPTIYDKYNRLGDGLTVVKSLLKKSLIQHHSDPRLADINLGEEIIVGEFVDIRKPAYSDLISSMKASRKASSLDLVTSTGKHAYMDFAAFAKKSVTDNAKKSHTIESR